MNSRTGGCMCGAVRYELASDPFECGWCHCRTCQLSSGAPAMVFASVPVGDFRWTQGKGSVKRVQSSSFGYRVFCGDCGTPLYMRVEHEPNEIDFSVATLDQPGIVTPEFHIFWPRAGLQCSTSRTRRRTSGWGPISPRNGPPGRCRNFRRLKLKDYLQAIVESGYAAQRPPFARWAAHL